MFRPIGELGRANVVACGRRVYTGIAWTAAACDFVSKRELARCSDDADRAILRRPRSTGCASWRGSTTTQIAQWSVSPM